MDFIASLSKADVFQYGVNTKICIEIYVLVVLVFHRRKSVHKNHLTVMNPMNL